MKSISCSNLVTLLCVLALAASITGCGVTLSPVKRKPLQIDPPEMSLAPTTQAVLVRFENTLLGKPLPETVWDNVSGAFWDVEESNQIGFTQNYSKYIPVVAVGGVIGGAVGAASDPSLIETRIVIPFGRIFEGTFRSGLSKAFPNSSICFDDQCEEQTLASGIPQYLVRVKVSEFQVWEQPLNHINLKAVAVSKVYRHQNLAEPLSVHEGRQELTKQSMGSVFSTSSGFISEMNKISNRFAGALSEDIIGNIQKGLHP